MVPVARVSSADSVKQRGVANGRRPAPRAPPTYFGAVPPSTVTRFVVIAFPCVREYSGSDGQCQQAMMMVVALLLGSPFQILDLIHWISLINGFRCHWAVVSDPGGCRQRGSPPPTPGMI